MSMKKRVLVSVMFLCTMVLVGCNEKNEQWEKEEVEELLESYYEPYYFSEAAIIDTTDEDVYEPGVEFYSVFEDEDEQSVLFNVKVYTKTGKVEEIELEGGLLGSYNLKDIGDAEVSEDTKKDGEEETWIPVEGSSGYNSIDQEGEYIWIDNNAFDRNGEIIYSLPEKYQGQEIGNGYMMVLEQPSGYQQKTAKMGVIDGYGNEVIPVSEEFAKVCGEELPYPKECEDGIVDFEYKEVVVDANQGIYYEDMEGFTDYQNNMMLSGWILYKDRGTSTVDYGDYYEYGRNITLSDDAVIVSGMEEGDFVIWTFDLNGTLINENRIADIKVNQEELNYENGLSALYIEGVDGDYVTMIDEQGNFLFEPIHCYNHDFSDQIPIIYGEVSEGMIRVAVDETTTIFVDSNGKESVRIPANINCVGECENGRIAVNAENGECFYINVETGENLSLEVE